MNSLDIAPRVGTPILKMFRMCSGKDLRDEELDDCICDEIIRNETELSVARRLSIPEEENETDPVADILVPENLDEIHTTSQWGSTSTTETGRSLVFGIDAGHFLQICVCLALVAYEYKRTMDATVAGDAPVT